LLLTLGGPVAGARAASDGNWPMAGHDYANTRFVALSWLPIRHWA
jgi:hypothetical protein